VITDIVPIVYTGGAGGQFLSSFIKAAKDNTPNVFRFSRFGNAHMCRKDFNTIVKLENEPLSKIVPHMLLEIDNVPILPVYTSIHENNILETLTYFEKIILITYDETDIDEISKAFTGKWGLDTSANNFIKDIKNVYLWSKADLSKKLDIFQNAYGDRVFPVTWKELYKEDTSILINKLSKYTGYEVDRFPLKGINEWRRLTGICIDEITRRIL